MKKYTKKKNDSSISILDTIKSVIKKDSLKHRVIIILSMAVVFFGGIYLTGSIISPTLVSIPENGGTLKEGITNSPRFINPVLAMSDADKDMSALVYSGLTRKIDQETLVMDLAQDYEISNDNLTYTFTLRDDIFFHDGEPVTAWDISYTVKQIQDPLIKSPNQLKWEGVRVSVLDDKTISFILRQPFASFLEHTTIGILPMHIWEKQGYEEFSFSPQNIEAIGSGPYKIKDIKTSRTGRVEEIKFLANKKYVLGKPYLKKIIIKSFKDEESRIKAFNSNSIDSIYGISPENLNKIKAKDIEIFNIPLARVFGIFFNQNNNKALQEKAVRQALELAIDREALVENALNSYAQPIVSPLPLFIYNQLNIEEEKSKETAAALLENAGWKLSERNIREKNGSPLSITLTTGTVPELENVIQQIAKDWRELGVQVNISIHNITSLNNEVIRTRKYEALFFGQIINSKSDLYAFWHSSQRNHPGLNIASYSNSKVDKILEDSLEENNETKRLDMFRQFNKYIKEDIPAIFIYSPDLIYITKNPFSISIINELTTSDERFLKVFEWYEHTDQVLRTFIK